MPAVLYATADDVRSAVARDPSKTTGTAASMDDDELTAQLVNAQAEVDAKLRARYKIPFVPCPALVRNITIDIAAYLSTLLYRQSKDLAEADPVMLRYKRSQHLLAEIMAGKADLDAGDGGAAQASTGSVGAPVNPYLGQLTTMADFGLGYGWDRRWDHV